MWRFRVCLSLIRLCFYSHNGLSCPSLLSSDSSSFCYYPFYFRVCVYVCVCACAWVYILHRRENLLSFHWARLISLNTMTSSFICFPRTVTFLYSWIDFYRVHVPHVPYPCACGWALYCLFSFISLNPNFEAWRNNKLVPRRTYNFQQEFANAGSCVLRKYNVSMWWPSTNCCSTARNGLSTIFLESWSWPPLDSATELGASRSLLKLSSPAQLSHAPVPPLLEILCLIGATVSMPDWISFPANRRTSKKAAFSWAILRSTKGIRKLAQIHPECQQKVNTRF